MRTKLFGRCPKQASKRRETSREPIGTTNVKKALTPPPSLPPPAQPPQPLKTLKMIENGEQEQETKIT